MLARMCRNCNFCAVVRNAKCSAATIKIITEVPKKIKCRITTRSKKFTPKYILKEFEADRVSRRYLTSHAYNEQ